MTLPPDAAGEAALFSSYLLRTIPAPELIERYSRACAALFPDPPSPRDRSLLDFALRHPRLLPALDAAAALVIPGSLLRRKILVMAAVLEATPDHVDEFLPRARSPIGFALLLLRTALSAALNAALGLPLLALAQRTRA